MLIPTISTLRVEDFPGEQSWIARLLLPINSFLTAATAALNGNITLGDNIPCQTFTLSFTYQAATDFPKQVSWKLSQNQLGSNVLPPVEIRVCSATENGSGIAVVVAWSYGNGSIAFPYIVKLNADGTTGVLKIGATYNIVMRGQP